MAAHGGSELERGEIDVAGVRRSYWLARAPRWPGRPAPPLLIALHGSGMSGRNMAWLTGLAKRGPAAGITVAFPDGWGEAWHPMRPPDAEPKLDDARFLLELATCLEGLGAASSWPVFLTGLSQGARYAEHVARHGQLPVTGLFLVAGTALECSRRLSPAPQLRVGMTLVIGTADPTTPFDGGALIRRGLSGRVLRRRAAKHGELPGEDIVVGAEALMINWAGANGVSTAPAIRELDLPGDLPVTRKAWARPGAQPVTLYRVNGGGHGWPGGPQYLPSRVIGPISRHLDATGLLLDMAERETASATGRPTLNLGDFALPTPVNDATAPKRGLSTTPSTPIEAVDGAGDRRPILSMA
jgi:polyhydroxybutyrate depolymerase